MEDGNPRSGILSFGEQKVTLVLLLGCGTGIDSWENLDCIRMRKDAAKIESCKMVSGNLNEYASTGNCIEQCLSLTHRGRCNASWG